MFMGLFILGIGYQNSHGQTPEDEVLFGIDSPKPIPDWLKNNFRWYLDGQITQKELLTSINWLLNNNYMHISEDSAREVQELRDQVAYLKEILVKTNTPIDIEGGKSGNESSVFDTLRSLAVISESQPKVNKLVNNAINNGTQNFDEWNNIILQIREDVSRTDSSLNILNDSITLDSTVEDLQKVVVLCNTAFDKESGILGAEINLISGIPKIKTSTQEDSSVGTIQEIERNYWLGKLGKAVEKIKSLQMGVIALQDYVQLIEPNLKSEDVTDSYLLEEIQRQKERLDEISNTLKDQHDVIDSIIQNIRA